MRKTAFIFYILSFFITVLNAQNLNTNTDSAGRFWFDMPETEGDTIPRLQRNEKGLIVIPQQWEPLSIYTTLRDTMFYDPAFLPIVFDGRILPRRLDFIPKDTLFTPTKYHLIDPDSTLLPLIKRIDKVQVMRRNYYMNLNNIDNIKYSRFKFPEEPKVVKEEEVVRPKNFLREITKIEESVHLTPPTIERFSPGRIYWRKSGEHSLQVSQNRYSDNWYNGGNNNFVLRSYQKFNFNYKKDKLNFDNTVEWRLGLQNSSGDTLHNVVINDDLFRTYSVFGYQAYNRWSYSSTLEMKTQIFNTYPENSNDRKVAFMSPFELNLGVGMSYNLEKKFENNLTKKLNLSLDLAPLSVKLKYVADKKVKETDFGIEEGHHSKTEYGSMVNANLTFSFNKFVTWTSRFKYFTTYENVASEFENKLNMSLNRYFSTSVYLYLRFDDNGAKDDKLRYVQMNEVISFGLNYKW